MSRFWLTNGVIETPEDERMAWALVVEQEKLLSAHYFQKDIRAYRLARKLAYKRWKQYQHNKKRR